MALDRSSSMASTMEFERILETGEKPKDPLLNAAPGPMSDSYEKFVHKIFTPAGEATRGAKCLADFTETASWGSPGDPLPDIPLSVLSKMEEMESGGLSEDKSGRRVFSPLEMMYSYYNQCGMEDQPYSNFPVYQPKTSSEYHSIKNKIPRIGETPSIAYKVAKTTSSPNIWSDKPVYEREQYRIHPDSRRTIAPSQPHYMLLDYKDQGAPVSPYLYPKHNFVHREDSRIVGSNFVMLTLRPEDPWKNKVDKLLQQAKNC